MRLAVVCCVLALLSLALLATPAGVAADHGVARWAAGLDRSHPMLHGFMRLGTEIGTAKWVLLGLFLPAAYGTEAARLTAGVAFAGLLGSQATVSGLKWAVGRPRPDGDRKRGNSSFPSSHAAAAAGIAWVVAERHRRLALPIWLVALWIAASRVFLERHYPSDVLAGAAIGILFAALALRLETALRRRRGRRSRAAAPAA